MSKLEKDFKYRKSLIGLAIPKIISKTKLAKKDESQANIDSSREIFVKN